MAEPSPSPSAGMRPIGVVRVPESHDTVIQARYAPVARGVVELDDGVLDALDGLDGFDFAWLVTLLDRAADPRDDPSARIGSEVVEADRRGIRALSDIGQRVEQAHLRPTMVYDGLTA